MALLHESSWHDPAAHPIGGMRESLRRWRSRLRFAGVSILASSIGSLFVGPIDASWSVLGLLIAVIPFAAVELLTNSFRCPCCCATIDWRAEGEYCDRCASRLP